MTNYVDDTAAGKSISAYIILDKKGNKVATVRAHFGSSGSCLVNVFNMDGSPFQHSRASGYGYDKFTAALSGLVVAGITLNDHSGTDETSRKLLKAYRNACAKIGIVEYNGEFQKAWDKKAEKIGAKFSNWDASGFGSLHYEGGLDKLKTAGFKVIRAI